MPCGHHFTHHYGYGPQAGYACPYCGYSHAPGYGAWGPAGWPGRWWGYGPAAPPPGWVPPAPPMGDEETRRMIEDRLRADPRIPPQAQILVEVREGVVTLTGMVPDKWVKYAAGDAALGLPSVVDVQNNLQVARPGRGRSEGGSTW